MARGDRRFGELHFIFTPFIFRGAGSWYYHLLGAFLFERSRTGFSSKYLSSIMDI